MPTDRFAEINKDSRKFNERYDCAVKALAIVADIPYAQAHAALKEQGRHNRCGTFAGQYEAALKKMGFQCEKMGRIKGQQAKTTKTLARIGAPQGRYLVRTSRHVLAVADGQVHDWTSERLCRIKDVWQVYPPKRKAIHTRARAKVVAVNEPEPSKTKTGQYLLFS
ncbi:MAG: hypothetical protein NXI32_04930 [bacterium]|nr:hypothetical protein [bacterium]